MLPAGTGVVAASPLPCNCIAASPRQIASPSSAENASHPGSRSSTLDLDPHPSTPLPLSSQHRSSIPPRNHPIMAQSFVPKQVIQYEASHMDELQGDVSETVIKASMKLLGPVPEGGVVHDNACGSGVVSETIMTSTDPAPPKSLHIDATDVNENFVKGTEALAQQHGWPLTAIVMDSYNLTFPDNRFDQSWTTFAFHCMTEGEKAAANIYRTLKPGGKVCAAVWVDMPHADAIQQAHWATRGDDGPMPALLPRDAYTTDQLKQALMAGGFDEAKISIHFVDAYRKITDIPRWSLLGWSYLGTLPHGWNKEDEDKWDTAVAKVEESLKTGRNTTLEKGVLTIKMTAAVGVATK
jgi:SAM-dependent methyltransferase